MRNEFQEMVLGAARTHKVRNNSGKKFLLVFVVISGLVLFSGAIAAIVYLRDHPVKFPPSKPKSTDQEKKEKLEVSKLATLPHEQGQPVKKAEQKQERPAQPKPAERPSEPKAPERVPQLDAWQIEIGNSYLTDGGSGAVSFIGSFNTWAKVQQIIDDDNMLIDITNNKDKGWVLVWAKFSTRKLSDGKFDFLANIIGTNKITVTGRKQYTSAVGAMKTVFVIEASK